MWIIFFPILLEGVDLIISSPCFQRAGELFPTILDPWTEEKGVLDCLFLSFAEAADRRALNASLPQIFCSEDSSFQKGPIEVFDFRDAFRFPGSCVKVPIGGWVAILKGFVSLLD